ncbi:hypothetical protein QR98_0022080 [Sarcoptes scabiei]|uniref:Uncharacterized protein n=1 Tax=Sarcoptes scabiei TaxID=52283 RepID=A0A131ZYK3_SARSC|nr:hypothetical protein QR98_0022080 [Sarcoptes scabiei]
MAPVDVHFLCQLFASAFDSLSLWQILRKVFNHKEYIQFIKKLSAKRWRGQGRIQKMGGNFS